MHRAQECGGCIDASYNGGFFDRIAQPSTFWR
jgi:hypothetical protein